MRKQVLTAIALTGALGITGARAAQEMTHKGLPPMDPVLTYAEQIAPKDEFFLNSDEDVELIRFSSMRDNTVCVPRERRRMMETQQQSVGLNVTWDGNKALIEPGHCLSFDAKNVSVKPAGPLPDSEELVGTIRTTK